MRPSKVKVVYLGVPLEEFSRERSAGEIAEARRELGIRADEQAVGTITRLHESKGNSYLVDAAARVVAERPAARFFVVGEGPLLRDLQAQAAALGLGDRFVFAGFRRDIARTLSAFDLSVFPSLWEGTPLTAFEALAMGKADRRDRCRRPARHPHRRPGCADRPQAKRRGARGQDRLGDRSSRGAGAPGGDGPTDRPAIRHRHVRPQDGTAVYAARRDLARHASQGRAAGRSVVSDVRRVGVSEAERPGAGRHAG